MKLETQFDRCLAYLALVDFTVKTQTWLKCTSSWALNAGERTLIAAIMLDFSSTTWGKMGVCLFFLVFQSREHSLNHHAVIIARKKITKVHLTPERLCLLFLQRSMCTSTAFGWPILFPTFFFSKNKQTDFPFSTS